MGSRPELKLEDEAGFVRFFRNLPSAAAEGEAGGTVRLFDRGDYYTAHGDDAVFIARTMYKTTSVLRTVGRDPGLQSVTMTVTVYRNFLREALFRLGRRVEIYTTSGRMNWKVAKHASPGNLQDVEDELGNYFEAAPIILAVKVSARASEARSVGICFADASVRELGVSEFLDNDLYSNFEAMLIQLGVKECVVQIDITKKDVELAKLRQIADNCGCAVAERTASDFNARDVEQDMARLLRDEQAASMLPQTELKLAMGAAAALIKYLNVLQDPENYGRFRLYQHDLSQFMKLDAAALKALNLMPGPRDSAKTMSLYGLLNHCKTPLGSRLLAQWLKQPLMDVTEIEKRQTLVEAFFNDTELRQTMQEDHLRSIPDLYRLAKKFQRSKANLEDVVRGYQIAIRLPALIGTLEGVMDETYKDALDVTYTQQMRDHSRHLGRLCDMVETTIDLDALDNHEFIIKPDFDDGLRIIRKKLDKLKRDMDTEHRRVCDDLNQDMDKKLFLENHRVHGWCFRLTRTEAGCIRGRKGYMERSTQKNGVYFTTPDLESLRREHDALSENYNRTQSGLAGEVVAVAASYVPVFEKLAGVLGHLDVIIAFAHVSALAPTQYTRPKIYPRASECTDPEAQSTRLYETRHACLEAQDGVNFITNDIFLSPDSSSSDTEDNSRSAGASFLIITGPNMGGKSTYIRTLAQMALLAQVGMFIPAGTSPDGQPSSINLHDSILARVGASDSQLRGISTFMSEMLETANILKSATRDSLIIIDELGRGTSTYDGFGLAWAIAEEILSRIRCACAFATHFHELTRLADTWSQVVNLHVVAHVDAEPESDMAVPSGSQTAARRQVTLLYKVEQGTSDQSFGIHVAELVRFPRKVINMARRKAQELEEFESTTSTDAAIAKTATATPEEVEQATVLLKEMLKQWKARVEEQGLGPAGQTSMPKSEQVAIMRELVASNEALKSNPFFKSVQAL